MCMSNMKPMLVMALLPLCCAVKQQCICCLKKYAPDKLSVVLSTTLTNTNENMCNVCSLMLAKTKSLASPSPVAPHSTSAKMHGNYYPEVNRARVCETHRISMCPICHSEDYAQRRICNVVGSALKRLGLKKTMSYLEYLGADSWSQVLRHLALKRAAWNALHPDVPMTLTNTALDHIRPVSSFKQNGVGAQTLMCNHYTNLQPLLHEDNSWKGEFWSLEDEKYWHHNIIMQPSFRSIYYPGSAPSQPSLLRAA
jgi:hypothetical protein